VRDRVVQVGRAVSATRVLARAGLLRPVRPDRLLGMGLALRRRGMTLAAAYAVQAAVQPDEPAIVDELGQVSFAEMEWRTDTIAAGFADLGIGPDRRVGLLCRNHRGFVEAAIALAKMGADAVYLNTGFAGPQLVGVLEREGVDAIVVDEDLLGVAGALPEGCTRVLAWRNATTPDGPSFEAMLQGGRRRPPAARGGGRQIVLTSGTTGAPRGASRANPSGLEPLVTILSRIPLHARDVTLVSAPLFHAWGLAHLGLGLALGSTLVLRRRFDPTDVLRQVEQEQVRVLVVVPVMLQRIMELPVEVRTRYDTASLQVVASSGSSLPAELALRVMDAFGDVLYNLYGSTEVAWASIATPEDLRRAPGTAGTAPAGTVVRLLDVEGRPVPAGQPGRIFVGNSMVFGGYTGGGSKEVVDGLMATGDVGHIDGAGRLFVEGREDDMIVSGGENVFPREVEDLLGTHDGVADCCVVGVPDDEFGTRLKAYIVRRPPDEVDAETLRAYVRDRLARYKVPRDVEFIAEVPRNSTGKILRDVLRG